MLLVVGNASAPSALANGRDLSSHSDREGHPKMVTAGKAGGEVVLRKFGELTA